MGREEKGFCNCKRAHWHDVWIMKCKRPLKSCRVLIRNGYSDTLPGNTRKKRRGRGAKLALYHGRRERTKDKNMYFRNCEAQSKVQNGCSKRKRLLWRTSYSWFCEFWREMVMLSIVPAILYLVLCGGRKFLRVGKGSTYVYQGKTI